MVPWWSLAGSPSPQLTETCSTIQPWLQSLWSHGLKPQQQRSPHPPAFVGQQHWLGWDWSCGAEAMTKVIIQYQDQFGKWHRLQEMNNEAGAYRTAKAKTRSRRRRFRLVDSEGIVLDIVNP